jgi:hypothetical protein
MSGYGIDTRQDNAVANPEPPKFASATEHFRNDIFALQEFFTLETAPKIQDRSTKVNVVRCYGFGDASGTGFGSTIQSPSRIKYRIGVWGKYDE